MYMYVLCYIFNSITTRSKKYQSVEDVCATDLQKGAKVLMGITTTIYVDVSIILVENVARDVALALFRRSGDQGMGMMHLFVNVSLRYLVV